MITEVGLAVAIGCYMLVMNTFLSAANKSRKERSERGDGTWFFCLLTLSTAIAFTYFFAKGIIALIGG